MDRVRFGRALGVGARAAAKSLMQAAEAAAAPDPRATAEPERRGRAAAVAQKTVAVKQQATQAGKRMWSPLARFSSVLWLEVTGTFFAIFALMPGMQAWKLRSAAIHTANVRDTQKFYLYLVVCAVFGYFAVTGFVRAKRRQQR